MIMKILILTLLFAISSNASFAADQWNWNVVELNDDIYLQNSKNKKPMFRFRLGAGGSISELFAVCASNQSMLSPSFQGEVTDRIIQWTIWDHGLKNPDSPSKKFERRFNITQGGTFDNLISPIIEVNIKKSQIDVYSLHADQWSPKNREQFQSQISALTRYEMREHGVLRIRRFLQLGDVSLKGEKKKLTTTYLESWTPFLRSEKTFQGLAVSLDKEGVPNWWYKAGENIPAYPSFDVQKTPGYAVVYNTELPKDSLAIGVVFGTKHGKNNKSVLNSMEWNTGIGVLPGLNFKNAPTGCFIEMNLEIVPRSKLSSDMAALLLQRAKFILPSIVFYPSDDLEASLQSIRNQLVKNRSRTGKRTEHLRPLVQSQ